MKKVLMLATYYPPAGGISTFRITKFVKYLNKFNWCPIVLTVNEDSYRECDFFIDDSLMKDIPTDLVIYRTGLTKSPFFFKYYFNNLSTRWLFPLFNIIGNVIKKEKPDILFATGDPFFPLLVAPFAKYFYNLEYIIDLRDPWKLAIPDTPPKGIRSRLKKPINYILEPIVINSAAKIVVVSEKMAQEYRIAYPLIDPLNFVVIPNGYDPEDYDSVIPVVFNKFTILYAGKFLSGNSFRNPTYFFQALQMLKIKNIIIDFKYVGEINNDIEKLIQKFELQDQFKSIGKLSYSNTISYMKGADLLLLIGSGQPTEQTGKIFDYLGCKKPILALAPSIGGIADVVKDLSQVVLVDYDDTNNIASAIENIYLGNTSTYVEDNKYHRKTLTKNLADLFSETLRKEK